MRFATWLCYIVYFYVLWLDRRYLWVGSPMRRPLWYWGGNARLFRLLKTFLFLLAAALLLLAYDARLMALVMLPTVAAGWFVSMVFYAREVRIIRSYLTETIRNEHERRAPGDVQPTEAQLFEEADRAARRVVMNVGRSRPYERA